MARILGYIATSLDGFIATQEGSLDWLFKYDTMDLGEHDYRIFIKRIRTVVMGRDTYDFVHNHPSAWEYADQRVIVVTSRPLPNPKGPLELRSDVDALVAELRALDDGDVWMVGGGKLQMAFMERGALDEIEIYVIPEIIGAAPRCSRPRASPPRPGCSRPRLSTAAACACITASTNWPIPLPRLAAPQRSFNQAKSTFSSYGESVMAAEILEAELNTSVLSLESGRHTFNSTAIAQLLEHHMGIGTFRLDLRSGNFYGSDAACRTYGLQPTRDAIPLKTIFDALVREDKRRGVETLTRAIARKCGYRYVLRVNDPVRGVRTIECFADVEINHQGAVIAVIGTVQDISERAAIDAQAAGRSLLMRALMHNIPAAIAVLDRNMRYIAVSDYWAAGHGVKSPRDLIGKSHYEEHPEITQEMKREHRQVLEGSTLRRPRAFLKDKNGNSIRQTSVMCPWYTIEKQIGGMMILLGAVDVENTLPADKSTRPLPTHEEFLELLAAL